MDRVNYLRLGQFTKLTASSKNRQVTKIVFEFLKILASCEWDAMYGAQLKSNLNIITSNLYLFPVTQN